MIFLKSCLSPIKEEKIVCIIVDTSNFLGAMRFRCTFCTAKCFYYKKNLLELLAYDAPRVLRLDELRTKKRRYQSKEGTREKKKLRFIGAPISCLNTILIVLKNTF